MKTIDKVLDRDDVIYDNGKDTHAIYKNKNGEIVPSATTVLKIINKPALLNWANWLGLTGKSYKKHMEMVSYIGTTVHEIIECRLLGKKFELKDPKVWFLDCKEYINSFNIWYKENPLEPIAIEDHMESDRFGGTCDFYGIYNGKKTIIDFKTSKGVYMSMFIQLAAYIILREEKGDVVEQVGILTINKDKCYITLADRIIMDDYIQMFYKCLDLFYEKYQLDKMYNWKED